MAKIRDLEARAQSYTLSNDPSFEDDLREHLRAVDGSGWTIDTSRTLGRRDDDGCREAAWWLMGRGATVCALDLPAVDRAGDPMPLGRAVAPRTGLDSGRFFLHDTRADAFLDEVGEGQIDVVAVAGPTIVLLRSYRPADEDDGAVRVEDLPTATLAPLVFLAEAWEPPEGHKIALWLDVTVDNTEERSAPDASQRRLVRVVRNRPVEGDWEALIAEPDRYIGVQAVETPPGRDGPAPGDVRIGGSPDDALRTVPPCHGAIVGASLLDLFEAGREASGLGMVEVEALRDRVADALGLDGSLADAPIRAAVDENPLLSTFKLGDTVYPYLSPSGIVRAAELSHQLGGSITADEAIERIGGQNATIASTIKQIQHRSRKGELSPFFDDR